MGSVRMGRSATRGDAAASRPRVLVISKKSAYDYYVRRYKMTRVRELLRAKDPAVARLLRADRDHSAAMHEVREVLAALGAVARFRDRSQIGSVAGFDLVITVGGDGTLLSVSHAVGDTPVFGINSAPKDSVGWLCSAKAGHVGARLRAALRGELPETRLCRMRVRVDGRVAHTRVLNDVLFAHKNPAMTARYILSFRGTREEHKSSGVWVGPAAGSTAAIQSAGGRPLVPTSTKIQFVVREPYRADGSAYEYTHGLVRRGEPFEIWNQMREAMLFIDGPRQPIPLEIGHRVSFDLSPEPLRVLGFRGKTAAE